ncbi:MAG: hypothetical protein ACI4KF_03755 [Huintestinicola sp.]
MKISKLSKSIAAVAAAGVIASQTMAISALAVDYYYYVNGVYYSTFEDALYEAHGGTYESVPASRVTGVTRWYSQDTHKIYNTLAEAQAAGDHYSEVIVPTNSAYYGYGLWYSSLTGQYYNTYADAVAASNGHSEYVSQGSYYGYTGTYYYSTVTGRYYTSYSAALSASNNDSTKVVTIDGNNYYYGTYGYGYYSTLTHRYYSTYAAALAASNNNPKYVVSLNNSFYNGSYSSIYRYYFNGVFYGSLQEAINAGGTALGVDIFYTPYGFSGDVTYVYYYDGHYYGSLAAAQAAGGTKVGVDIFYVPEGYYGSTNNVFFHPYGYVTGTTTTSTTTASDGTPYIYGKSTKHGWNTIIKYLKNSSKGSTVTIDMNGSAIVSGDALAAIKGKNVNLTCVLDNGAKWTINGKDVVTAADMNIYVEYNANYIPSKLLKKGVKDSVSYTQVAISNKYGDLNAESLVTVKFNKKRAGLTAHVYVYDNVANSLKGVCKSKVLSDGSCTFTAEEGGPYLIVLK